MTNPSIKAKIQEIRAMLNSFGLSQVGEPQKGDEIHQHCSRLQVLVEDVHAMPSKLLPDRVKHVNGELAEFERQVTNAAMGPGFILGTSNRDWLELASATLKRIEEQINELPEK